MVSGTNRLAVHTEPVRDREARSGRRMRRVRVHCDQTFSLSWSWIEWRWPWRWALDERGALVMSDCPGDHMQFSDDWFLTNVIDLYLRNASSGVAGAKMEEESAGAAARVAVA